MKKKIEKKKVNKEKYLTREKALKMADGIDDNFDVIDRDLRRVEEDINLALAGLLQLNRRLSNVERVPNLTTIVRRIDKKQKEIIRKWNKMISKKR